MQKSPEVRIGGADARVYVAKMHASTHFLLAAGQEG